MHTRIHIDATVVAFVAVACIKGLKRSSCCVSVTSLFQYFPFQNVEFYSSAKLVYLNHYTETRARKYVHTKARYTSACFSVLSHFLLFFGVILFSAFRKNHVNFSICVFHLFEARLFGYAFSFLKKTKRKEKTHTYFVIKDK